MAFFKRSLPTWLFYKSNLERNVLNNYCSLKL